MGLTMVLQDDIDRDEPRQDAWTTKKLELAAALRMTATINF